MGDNESVSSDWESFRGDDAAAATAKLDATNTTRVVVELPCEGLNGVAAAGALTTAAGATASHVDHLELQCGDANDDNDSQSAAGSSISSFVPISRFDKMSMQKKVVAVTMPDGNTFHDTLGVGDENNESTAGSSMSSFAHVSKFEVSSSTASSEMSPYHYKSEASFHQFPANLSSNHHTADDTEDDSLLGNFEMLSLSSGEVVLRCKRCTFHNETDAIICSACQLALVANPNIDIDAQIAAHIAEEEERIRDDPFFDHASILTNDIIKACRRSGDDSFANTFTIQTLPECYLKPLAVDFIQASMVFPDPKTVFLAFKCTSNSRQELECIQKRGLEPDQPFLNPTQVEVSHSLKNAMESFQTLQMMRGELCTIHEDNAAEGAKVSHCLCWMVAIVAGASESPEPSGLNTSWPPNQTFPVAYFDTSLHKHAGNENLLGHLMRTRVHTVLDEFFDVNSIVPLKSDASLPDTSAPFQMNKEGGAEGGDGLHVTNPKRQRATQAEHDITGHMNPVASKLLKIGNNENNLHDAIQGVEMENNGYYSSVESPALNRSPVSRQRPTPRPMSSTTWPASPDEELCISVDVAEAKRSGAVDLVRMQGCISTLVPFRGGIICGNGNEICLLNEELSVFKTFNVCGNVTCVASASIDEQLLIASGNDGGYVFVHDLPDLSKESDVYHKANFVTGIPGILSVAFLPKKQSVAAVSRYRECYLFNIEEKTCICKMMGQRTAQIGRLGPYLHTCMFSPDGKALASVMENENTIHFWRLDQDEAQPLTGHEMSTDTIGRDSRWINGLAFSSCGKYLASAGNDCAVRIWGIQKRNIHCVTVIKVPAALNSLAFSQNSKSIVVGCVNGMVDVWNIFPEDPDSPPSNVASYMSNTGSVKHVTFMPDSKCVVSAGYNDSSHIKIWPTIGRDL